MKNKKIFYGFLIFIIVGIISVLVITNINQEKPKTLPTSTTTNEWGPIYNGIKTRLIPLQQEYILEQPIKFRLEMTNVGSQSVLYDDQQVDVNNPLIVKGPDGKETPYIAGSVQTLGGPKPINPAEVVILFDGLDVASQYYIGKAGQYTVQFRGGDRAFGEIDFPKSNVVEIGVKSGKPTKALILTGRLLDILPEGWTLTAWPPTQTENEVTPYGRQPAKGLYAALVREAGLKADVIYISIWQTDEPVDITNQTGTNAVSEYLGKNQGGYLYAYISSEAEVAWPDVREKIINALEVNQE